ncbi:sugar nucleotide-binding protein [Candidatus Woesebacteria bacterium]|nr:sugar nucleotide-binding protein [Candidatus Woesebacteria bacterium]
MKQTLLATGINGLVGSRFAKLFSDHYDFDSLDIANQTNPVDITDESSINNALKNSNSDFVVHLAAYTDVTGAWKQQGDKFGPAYKVNVNGTKNIIKACKNYGKHLIHVSTAYVFNGENEDFYTENDQLSPIEWYGQTKAEAEMAVNSSDINWTILRIDQPFRPDVFNRPDSVRRIINGLKNDSLYPQFTNHYFGPTFIDDFSKIIDWVIRTKSKGIYNSSSGEKWTDYDFANLINNNFKFEKVVKKGDLNEYLKTLDRPYQRNTALSIDKLKSEIDFELNSVESSIKLVEL